jgi:hypothetical protein
MKTRLSSWKHPHVTRVSMSLIMLALITGMVGCGGTYNPPSQNLEIRTWFDLDAVRGNLAGSHRLMNNLDSTTPGYEELASPTSNGGKGWQPIGTPDGPFTGSFDGQGYEIHDLFINRPDESCIGLFGYLYKASVIKNLGAMNVIVTGNESVGGLLGYNGGYDVGVWPTVTDCYSTGNVTGSFAVGGLVGGSSGRVTRCHSSANVTGERHVAGLVEQNNVYIDNS